MAWRDLIGRIFEVVLARLTESVDDVEKSANTLVAAADALYSPLKAIDAGFGEARRLASRFSSLAAAVYAHHALAKAGEETLKQVVKALEKVVETYSDKPHPEAKKILEEANVTVELAFAPEPREAVVKSIRDYVEPKQPTLTRRRRAARKPEPQRDIRRILRELGRINPMLAYTLTNIVNRYLESGQ